MKVELNVGKLTLTAEGATPKEIFRDLAQLQFVFEDSTCGKCGSSDLQYIVRTAEGNDFYELRCKKCWAKLTFGTSKEEKELYPKRLEVEKEGKNKGKAIRDADGKTIPRGTHGWTRFNKETGKEE